MDLRALQGGRLLALHDATFAMDGDAAALLPQRNLLRLLDVERGVSGPNGRALSSKV